MQKLIKEVQSNKEEKFLHVKEYQFFLYILNF